MQITHTFKILNKLGLNMRAATELVKTSSKFKCRILVKRQEGFVDAKSLLNLMTLAAGYGQELNLIFEGEDAQKAWVEIQNLFSSKFGEKE